jgi:hypothetical protein
MLGQTIRSTTLQGHQELAVLVDAETGEELGPAVTGSTDRLELGPLLRRIAPGRRYVCVHTHPESSSFSPYDVALLLRFPAIQVVTAVGVDGSWYVVSLEPDQPMPAVNAMAAAVQAARDELAPRFEALVQTGALTRQAARRELSHLIWQRVAPPLGLRYDRVEGDGPPRRR